MVEYFINKYDEWDFTTDEIIGFFKDSTYSDEWINDKYLKTNTSRDYIMMKENQATECVVTTEEGINLEKIVNKV